MLELLISSAILSDVIASSLGAHVRARNNASAAADTRARVGVRVSIVWTDSSAHPRSLALVGALR